MVIPEDPNSISISTSPKLEEKFGSLFPLSGGIVLLYFVQLVLLLLEGRDKKKRSISNWEDKKYGFISSCYAADHYSFFHLQGGILFYYASSFKLGGSSLGERYLLGLTTHVVFEGVENNPYFLDMFGTGLDPNYMGDSVINSLSDSVWFSYGFWLASKLPFKTVLALLAMEEVFRGVFLGENSFSILWKGTQILLQRGQNARTKMKGNNLQLEDNY